MSNSLTLYYYLYDQPGDILNSTETLFVTDPVDNETYRGITNRFMSNSTFNSYTSDIIAYISSRSKETTINSELIIPPLYNEILTINSLPYQDNYIQATSNYIDGDSEYATSVNETNFIVTAASGKFKNYKNINIKYNNADPRKTRVLVFS